MDNRDLEILKIRFQYAWSWFDFHAKQRVTMFNYFLIITGIIANGMIASLNSCETSDMISIWLAIFGFFISIGFILLDKRNKQLVDLAEDVLLKLEKESIYGEEFKVNEKENHKDNRVHQGGFMLREYKEEPCYEKGTRIAYIKNSVIKHKIIIRFVELLVAGGFLLFTMSHNAYLGIILGIVYVVFSILAFLK